MAGPGSHRRFRVGRRSRRRWAARSPVLWDGAGSAIVNDDVAVLSLNLPDVSTPQSEAKPSPADLKGEAPTPLPGITLPAAMEAKVR